MEKLKKFNTQEEYQAWKDSDDYVYPNVCKVGDNIVYNDYPDPFWVEALEDVIVKIKDYNHYAAFDYCGCYSFDKFNWVVCESSITLRKGNKIYIKSLITDGGDGRCFIDVSGKHNIGGSVLSLAWGDEYLIRKYFGSKYSGYLPFISINNIINAKDLVLGEEFNPNSDSTYGAFENLFLGASQMISAPKLLKVPLKDGCYKKMFKDCVSLLKAPTIYYNTGSESYSCEEMFSGCVKLSYIKYMGIGNFNSKYNGWSYNWVQGVSPTGTFIANANRTDFTRGVSGIPEGWDLYLYDEDNDRYVVKFLVNSIPYEYYTDEPKDITWNEFINSEYNTNGFTAQQEDGETAKTIKFGDNYVLLSGNKVLITDKVILNASYTIGQPTATTELTETTNEEE